MARTENIHKVLLTEDRRLTLPVEVLEDAGIHVGDRLIVRASGPGRVGVETVDDFISRYAGSLPYPEGYLESLRNEWER